MPAISPKQVLKLKKEQIPEFVFDAFNQLIAGGISSGTAKVLQGDVVNRILQLAPEGTTRSEIFAKGWLDVEDIYRKAGWKVEYDKPGYCESYDAFFIFTGAKG